MNSENLLAATSLIHSMFVVVLLAGMRSDPPSLHRHALTVHCAQLLAFMQRKVFSHLYVIWQHCHGQNLWMMCLAGTQSSRTMTH